MQQNKHVFHHFDPHVLFRGQRVEAKKDTYAFKCLCIRMWHCGEYGIEEMPQYALWSSVVSHYFYLNIRSMVSPTTDWQKAPSASGSWLLAQDHLCEWFPPTSLAELKASRNGSDWARNNADNGRFVWATRQPWDVVPPPAAVFPKGGRSDGGRLHKIAPHKVKYRPPGASRCLFVTLTLSVTALHLHVAKAPEINLVNSSSLRRVSRGNQSYVLFKSRNEWGSPRSHLTLQSSRRTIEMSLPFFFFWLRSEISFYMEGLWFQLIQNVSVFVLSNLVNHWWQLIIADIIDCHCCIMTDDKDFPRAL